MGQVDRHLSGSNQTLLISFSIEKSSFRMEETDRNTQMSDNVKIGAITYTNTTSNRTLQGNNLSNPFRGYFTRSYNLSGLPFGK
jgi:hypothetical protein